MQEHLNLKNKYDDSQMYLHKYQELLACAQSRNDRYVDMIKNLLDEISEIRGEYNNEIYNNRLD